MISAAASLCALIVIGAFEYSDAGRSPLFPSWSGFLELQNPAGFYDPALSAFFKGGFISASGSNPYSLEGLTCAGLSGGYADGSSAFTAEWNRFGINEYMENTLSAGGGFSPADFFSAALCVSWYNQTINTPELNFKTDIFDFGISLFAKPFDQWKFLFRQKNLAALYDKRRSDLTYPQTGFAAQYEPVDGFKILCAADRTGFGTDYSAAVSINILKNFNIRGGYYPQIQTASAGFSFIHSNFSADYSIRFHPYLGGTHVFSLTASTENISVTPLKYHNRFFRETDDNPPEKIDINLCDENKIREIAVLEKEHAERIIKYRSVFGKLNAKSLRQIGMDTAEIKRFNRYIVPLAQKEEFIPYGAKGKRKINPAEEKKRAMKILFEKLSSEGISPLTAMNLVEASFSSDKTALDRIIDAEKNLSPDKKKTIRGICIQRR